MPSRSASDDGREDAGPEQRAPSSGQAPPTPFDVLSTTARARLVADEGLVDDAVAALRDSVLAWESYRLRLASHLGVTVNESAALSHLVAGGPMSTSQLGTLLGFSSGAMTLLVDRLEARGLIGRRSDPVDRRRVIVEASQDTHAHLAEMTRWLAVAFSDLDDDDVRAATGMLARIATELRGFSRLVAEAEGVAQPPRRLL